MSDKSGLSAQPLCEVCGRERCHWKLGIYGSPIGAAVQESEHWRVGYEREKAARAAAEEEIGALEKDLQLIYDYAERAHEDWHSTMALLGKTANTLERKRVASLRAALSPPPETPKENAAPCPRGCGG